MRSPGYVICRPIIRMTEDERREHMQRVKRATIRMMNAGRGVALSLPAPARSRLRDVLTWADRRPAPSLEGWSRPLIGPDPGAAGQDVLTAPTAPAAASPGIAAQQRGPSRVKGASVPAVRCLLVTCALDVGGMDEVVSLLARRLPAHHVQTAVLHATPHPPADGEPPGRLGRTLRLKGVEVHAANQDGGPGWIRRWRPDVISSHGAPEWVLAHANHDGVPYIETLHGMHDLFDADWQAEAARGVKLAAVVAVSELVGQQYLAGNRAFPHDRVVLIPNGVENERCSRGNRKVARDRLGLRDEYLFVSLARYCLQKNPYGLIAAFGELARYQPEAHLVIAGRCDDIRYFRQVKRLRDSLPEGDRIHLRDNLAAPAELLAAADGFVLDSFFEGWSLASTEALCAGVPVALSDVGGAREQIGDDAARGHLVASPLGDPLGVNWESIGAARFRVQVNQDELVKALEDLIANRKNHLRDRDRLATESAARFSVNVCLAKHAAVIRAIATGADLRAAGQDGRSSHERR